MQYSAPLETPEVLKDFGRFVIFSRPVYGKPEEHPYKVFRKDILQQIRSLPAGNPGETMV